MAAAAPALARVALTATTIAAAYTRWPIKRTENGVSQRRQSAQ